MSTLRLTTLSNQGGTASVPSDTVINGTAKAWVNFNGTGTVAIRGSFNVSSITDNGAGNYTVNLTTAMSDENYAPISNGNNGTSAGTTSAMMSSSTRVSSVSAYQIFVFPNDASGTIFDAANIHSAVFR